MLFILLFITLSFSQSYDDLSAFDQAIKESSSIVVDTEKVAPDTTNYSSEDEVDGLVYISIDDPEYRQIDSIQNKIFEIKKRLSSNTYGNRALSLDGVEQRRYMDYLDKYKLCSRPAIYAMALDIVRIKDLELRSAQIVLSTQRGDQRSMIFPHVKKLRDDVVASRSFLTYLETLNQ